MYRLSFVFLLVILVSCGTSKKETTSANLQPFILMDRAAAAQAIVTDTTDGFFDRVNLVEMEIQMKKNFAPGTTREQAVAEYRAFLQTEVLDFTEAEKVKVTAVMEEAKRRCDLLAPGIFPMGVALIKTRINHYGPSVYYTRENGIYIPENELAEFQEEAFLSVMLHEIFHVYSRFHPAKRQKLYSLVGFEPLEKVEIDPNWADVLLFNPDGVSYNWGVTLNIDGVPTLAVPLIYANEASYVQSKNTFFAYLEFSLHLATKQNDGSYLVGKPLGPNSIPALFEKITSNTQYIIHPDEIMADNFMFLTYPWEEGQAPQFDEAGQKLQQMTKAVLTEQ
ncbi:MAG: hypothetical protein KDC34_08355 [Saprospiraceae bacterium]|nr:hypothetical protein [Saprospiraceae bacterium]